MSDKTRLVGSTVCFGYLATTLLMCTAAALCFATCLACLKIKIELNKKKTVWSERTMLLIWQFCRYIVDIFQTKNNYLLTDIKHIVTRCSARP